MKKPKIDVAELGPLPPLRKPAVPLVDRSGARGEVTVTDAGLAHVEYLASEFATQPYCAAQLGIAKSTFEKLLGKTTDDPPTPLRAAWETGRAALETETNRYHLLAMRKGSAIQPMFISKTEFGKREAGPSVEINNSPRINISLPGSYDSIEADMKAHGQLEIIDARSDVAKNFDALQPPAPLLGDAPLATLGAEQNENLPAPVRPATRPEHRHLEESK